MSMLGPSIAGSVAQTSLQAQQVARQRDRAANQPVRDADRLQELLKAHLAALEEEDGFESPANLHVDQHLPDRHSKEEPPPRKKRKPGQPGGAGAETAAEASAPPVLGPTAPPPVIEAAPAAPPAVKPRAGTKPEAPPPLYRHLDVQG